MNPCNRLSCRKTPPRVMLVNSRQPHAGGKVPTCIQEWPHTTKMGVQCVSNKSLLVVFSAKHTQLSIIGQRLRNTGVNIRKKVKNSVSGVHWCSLFPSGLQESDFLNPELITKHVYILYTACNINHGNLAMLGDPHMDFQTNKDSRAALL